MSGAYVFIDPSQFPESVRQDLLHSLRARAINHKFHYESYKQAAKWLALHEAYSPAHTDASCARIYQEAFTATASVLRALEVHVIGLGCGAGQKEARLLHLLGQQNRGLAYSPCDVSLPLLLAAHDAALPFVDNTACHPVMCDLSTSEELTKFIGGPETSMRIITLFGVVPNFEPMLLFSAFSPLLRADDLILISANLAPGADYAAGISAVLPQYDNALTRDWLKTLLLDLGFEQNDGEIKFAIETDAHGLCRIIAHFEMKHRRDIRVFGETISFEAGERIRLFFSYRHTPETLRALASQHQIAVINEWLNDSREEGVFLCRKTAHEAD